MSKHKKKSNISFDAVDEEYSNGKFRYKQTKNRELDDEDKKRIFKQKMARKKLVPKESNREAMDAGYRQLEDAMKYIRKDSLIYVGEDSDDMKKARKDSITKEKYDPELVKLVDSIANGQEYDPELLELVHFAAKTVREANDAIDNLNNLDLDSDDIMKRSTDIINQAEKMVDDKIDELFNNGSKKGNL